MAYLKEREVRTAARSEIIAKSLDAAGVLRESVNTARASDTFDVFLCHSIRDADIVLGVAKLLERQGLKVYVDWVVDSKMDRSSITSATANILRSRMDNSRSLFYLYSENSTKSRWMPWELGYFDGRKGSVAIIPVVPDNGTLDFTKEEYLGLYPKAELVGGAVFVNRTVSEAHLASSYKNFESWLQDPSHLRL